MKETQSRIVSLVGNPNVGKSSIFNAITGLKQHTGNWSGKTVSNAYGTFKVCDELYTLIDLPGTYSLISSSKEEFVASDFICFEQCDCTVIVVDATSIQRNLNIVLQILERHKNVVIALNLMDEAIKKDISINIDELSLYLGVPVIPTVARGKKGIKALCQKIHELSNKKAKTYISKLTYGDELEEVISIYYEYFYSVSQDEKASRFFAIKMLDATRPLREKICDYFNISYNNENYYKAKENSEKTLIKHKINKNQIKDIIMTCIYAKSELIYNNCVKVQNENYNKNDRKIDRILTSKTIGIPAMLLLLGVIFWLTIIGANYPSSMLSDFFSSIKVYINDFLVYLNAPPWLQGILINGVYDTTTTVISVMLPPMAIFFPLFTILEDIGYLPRVAFNLDRFFKKSGTHGKQALTMCMGFGCNACAIVGSRIIDSPSEKIIAIVTNTLVPCNGRFPTIIAIITMFFVGVIATPFASVFSALLLLGLIILSVFITFGVSKMLSKTFLKTAKSSFILELPPYRKPQFGKIIIHSLIDRTLFVLARAVTVSMPAGVIIWILANMYIGDMSILNYCTNFLDPFASLLGLDGVILMAFILGFPANEIVLPIIIMSYMSTGTLTDFESLSSLHELFISNGWTITTAVCTIIFFMFHFPCSTTCISIYKETKSKKWTLLSFFTPLCVGLIMCFIVNFALSIFI